MLALTNYINESVVRVDEKFGSSLARDLFKGLEAIAGRRSSITKLPSTFMRLIPWDKLTEDDFEKLSIAKARNIFRSFDAEDEEDWNVIIWCDNTNTPVALTLGKSILVAKDELNKRITMIVKASKTAYLLSNPSLLKSVDKLRHERFKALDDVYGKEDYEYIARKNRERFQDKLRDMRKAGKEEIAQYLETINGIVSACTNKLDEINSVLYDRIMTFGMCERDDNPVFDQFVQYRRQMTDLFSQIDRVSRDSASLEYRKGSAKDYEEMIKAAHDTDKDIDRLADTISSYIKKIE